MTKEFLIVAGGIAVAATIACAIYAVIKYKQRRKEGNLRVERTYLDEASVGEIKKWFKERMTSANEKGIIMYPTEENIKKWNLCLEKCENVLVQIVYDKEKDEVIAYREIGFANLSSNMKELLDKSNGTIVIDY